MTRFTIPSLAIIILLLQSPGNGFAAVHSFTETFTTTTFRDAAATTLDWNTAAGEIRMFPFEMSITGSLAMGTALGVFLHGNQAYVAANGLKIVSLLDETAPTLQGSISVGSSCNDVFVTGNTALVAANGGMFVVDVTAPGAPSLVGSLITPAAVTSVTAQGTVAYLTTGGALWTVDVSNRALPVMLDKAGGSGATDVAVEGDVAYVLKSSSLVVYDVSDPAALSAIVSLPFGATSSHALVVKGDVAYVAHSSLGLLVVDVSDPGSPALITNLPLGVEPFDLAVDGDRAYIADVSGFALHSIDVSNPAAPFLKETLPLSGPCTVVAVAGEHAVVGNAGLGVQVVDVLDVLIPPRPADQGMASGQARDVVLHGNTAVLAVDAAGLDFFDISDPANISLIGNYNPGGMDATEVAVQGNYAYIADWAGGGALHIADISDPASPTFVSEIGGTGQGRPIEVHGDFVFFGNEFETPKLIHVIDVSNPAAPVMVDSATVIGDPRAFAVVGVDPMILYAATVSNVYVYEVGPGGVLTPLTTLGQSGLELAVYGRHLLVSNGALWVYDISTPGSPVFVDSLSSSAYGVVANGRHAIVRRSDVGVVDISDPANMVTITRADVTLPENEWHTVVDGDFAFTAAVSLNGKLYTTQIYQADVDTTGNRAQSITVFTATDTIRQALVQPVQVDSVLWELSANGGASWDSVATGTWHNFSNPGLDLLWRSTHLYGPGSRNPAVSELSVAWLYNAAAPDSLVDVPNDQGGWARLHFGRSAHDLAGEAGPIIQYDVYRRIPNSKPVVATRGSVVSTYAGAPHAVSILEGVSATGETFPPGSWEAVASLGALQADDYTALVPTLEDSSATSQPSEYVVVAHTTTPSVWFVSETVSGYSIDNIAPGVPQGFAASYNGSQVDLMWNAAPEPDFQYYRIYRDTDPGFVPAPGFLVHTTATTSWQDSPANPGAVYYKITALDHAGNEGPAAASGSVTAVGEGPGRPAAFRLGPAVPNPFRSGTRIAFELGKDSAVNLEVFDVAGRLVRRLVQASLPAGGHEIIWDGADDTGRGVTAGVYLYRLRAGVFESTRRMVMAR